MRGKVLFWHILGVFVFLLLPVFLSPRPPGTDFDLSRPDIRDLIANFFMVVFFYLNYYVFIPRVYFRKNFFLYGLIILFALGVICLLPSLMTGFVPWRFQNHGPVEGPGFHGHPEHGNFLMVINHHIFLFTCVVLFSVLLRLRDRILILEKSKHEMEIESLRRQINPHFLFNTLNGLYSSALKEGSKSAAKGIFTLSHMMRYVFKNTGQYEVDLSDEISYINAYVDLQRMRLDQGVKLKYEVRGDYSGKKIAPLILIPIIENAFKHGVNPDEESSIRISIECTGSFLYLKVTNKKVKVELAEHESSGKGLLNIKTRLDFQYPQKHRLEWYDSEDEYSIELNLDLSQ